MSINHHSHPRHQTNDELRSQQRHARPLRPLLLRRSVAGFERHMGALSVARAATDYLRVAARAAPLA